MRKHIARTGRFALGKFEVDIAAQLTRIEQIRASGRTQDAESLCRQLAAAVPNSASVLNSLALMVRDRGDLAEAESLLRRALSTAPREAALYNNLGNVLAAANDFTGAESAYRKAVELVPGYAEAFFNLGNAVHQLGRPEQALAAHRRAVAIKPNYAEALVQIAVLQSESGAKDDALKTLKSALAANPRLFACRYYAGTISTELHRFDEAIVELQAATALSPQRFEGHYALAKALAQAGREEEALSSYQRCIQLAPEFEPAHTEFNELSWTMGREVRDGATYAFARKRVGERPDLLLSEAELRMRFKDAQAAESLLRRALEQAPERGDLANALGRALVLQDKFEDSLPLYRRAIAAEPEALRHRQELGVALLKLGQPREAVSALEQALALSPHEQITLGYLALALRQLGDSRYDALVHFERFVRTFEIAPPSGFSDVAAFNRALGEELERLHTRRAAPLNQTLLNGTQTPGSLFANHAKALDLFRRQLDDAIGAYIANLPDDPTHPFVSRKDREFSLSGSWSCRLHSSGYHSNHLHNEGWISSAYYVALPDVVSEAASGQGALKFGESKFALGANDRPEHIVRPAVGKLVLFPSYFWHGTVPFTSQDARLTIAFDVMPGKAGVAAGAKRL